MANTKATETADQESTFKTDSSSSRTFLYCGVILQLDDNNRIIDNYRNNNTITSELHRLLGFQQNLVRQCRYTEIADCSDRVSKLSNAMIGMQSHRYGDDESC